MSFIPADCVLPRNQRDILFICFLILFFSLLFWQQLKLLAINLFHLASRPITWSTGIWSNVPIALLFYFFFIKDILRTSRNQRSSFLISSINFYKKYYTVWQMGDIFPFLKHVDMSGFKENPLTTLTVDQFAFIIRICEVGNLKENVAWWWLPEEFSYFK